MTSLTGHLLIAMPALADPNFSRTVTYICEHNEEGAFGLVINRPLDLTLGEVLAQFDASSRDPGIAAIPVYHGGPVQPEFGFVLHRGASWESTLEITEDIRLTTSRDILLALGEGKGPPESLIALGYAGWGAGQLEQELVDNTWLNTAATGTILFDTPAEERWAAAAALIGVDLSLLSGEAGHS